MTWKEFKDTVELQGVTDETEIKYIDVGNYAQTIRVIDDAAGLVGIVE